MTRIRAAGLAIILAASTAIAVSAGTEWRAAAPETPRKFEPAVVARPDTEESMLTVDAQGSEIYWAVSRKWFPYSRVAEIWTARRTAKGWRAKRADFSTGYSDVDPFVTPDGKTVFFASMRPAPGPRKDFDLYAVERTSATWGKARNLGPAVNSPEDELFPSVSADGTLYFGTFKAGAPHIYRAARHADGSYAEAEDVGAPVNLPQVWSFNPFISQDGRTLVFTAFNRAGGMGKGDIWVATGTAPHRFETVRNLGPAVNSAEDEFHPTLTPDRSALFFIRRTARPDANADVWWVSARGLGVGG